MNRTDSSRPTDRMLALALEIEGLILLIQRRGDLVHPGVNDILREKIADLAALAGGSVEPAEAPAAEVAPAVEAPIAPVAAAAPAPAPVEAPAEPAACVAEQVANDEAVAESALFEGEEDAGMQPEPVKTIADSKPTFTLNDKFLFRNELFDGDDTALDDALCIISRFSTAREVEEYLADDLCFDLSNPTAAAFLAAVTADKK